jgi:TRAP-type C4-dicarboxylate transport system substrate-binding protein
MMATSAGADPAARIRMAANAPEGTLWAREFHTIDREVAAATEGQLQLKWYLSGIAGDEMQALERVHKAQLDGEAGALFCDRLAPSIRVARVVGVFQSRDEWRYVMTRLLPELNREFGKSGFSNLGLGSFGNSMFFSRRPIRTMADLRSQRFWVYEFDDVTVSMLRHMGLAVVPLSVEQGLRAYEDGRIDGFVATATVALAFQWSARASYYSDLTVGELPGCFVIADRALDPLPLEHRRAVTTAVAKFVGRFEELGHQQDAALLGGLFERQGLHKVAANDELRAGFFEAARAARERLAPAVIAPELLTRTLNWLADYRLEHPTAVAR